MPKSKRHHLLSKPDVTLASAPPGISPQLIEQTLMIWQPYSRRDLSRDDAVEIIRNVTGFFKVLAEWQGREPPSE